MFSRLDLDVRSKRRTFSRGLLGAAALAATVITGCDRSVTAPESTMTVPHAPAYSVAPGTLAVYTDRSAWLAAVAAEGATAQEFDYTGLTTGRITSRSQDYGPFRIAVDFLSTNQFNNPGIDIIADQFCSLGTGDCNRMIFNMMDPSFTQTFPYDQPKLDSLVMPQPIVAFAATFSQTGVAVGCGTCPEVTGPVTIHFGSATYVLNTGLTNGFGFLGFVAGTPARDISFTFEKTTNYANDLIEVYRPEFATAVAVTETPSEKIADLKTLVAGLGLAKGTATSINAKLNAALAAIATNQTALACVSLQDELNFVSAQRGKKISAGDAATIAGSVSDIRAALGC